MAVTLTIDQGIGAVAGTPSGTRDVSPSVTTDYTLTATSAAGQVKTATARVTVQAAAGSVWTQQSSPVSATLNGVTYGAGKFVAVGNSGVIITSPDGINWTQQSSPVSTILYGVTYGAGKFVAVGESGVIITSPDGINWTQQSSPTSLILGNVMYGNGVFVAVGVNGITTTSSDGVNWTSVVVLGYGDSFLRDIAFGNGLFVCVGDNRSIYTSSNGVSWTAQAPAGPLNVENHYYSVTYDSDNGRFVFVGRTYSTVQESASGANWTRITTTGFNNNLIASDLIYAAGQFVTVASSYRIYTSVDGIDWISRTVGFTTLYGVAYGGGRFVAVGASGIIVTSP